MRTTTCRNEKSREDPKEKDNKNNRVKKNIKRCKASKNKKEQQNKRKTGGTARLVREEKRMVGNGRDDGLYVVYSES